MPGQRAWGWLFFATAIAVAQATDAPALPLGGTGVADNPSVAREAQGPGNGDATSADVDVDGSGLLNAAPGYRLVDERGIAPPPEAGAAIAVPLDEARTGRNSFLEELLRDYTLDGASPPAQGAVRAKSARDEGPQWDALDSVLRMVREAILSEDDSARFSFAGLDVNLALGAGRKSLTVNGYDLLEQNWSAPRIEESWRASQATPVPVKPDEEPHVIQRAPDSDYLYSLPAILRKIRDLIFQPVALIIPFALLGLWILGRLFSSARHRQSW